MKFLRAGFKNFRLLRDLDIEFSTDPSLKLTVLRAENETGKTTVLNALQWALYGEQALPGKGEDYRLHPIDWSPSESNRVPIDVTVDFEVTTVRRTLQGIKQSTKPYRVIRTAVEELSGTRWERTPSTVKLFQLTDKGAEPIDPPEAFIADELPPDLREVFFTDGDRALSFIEADVTTSTKRSRVQKAIRSLLGLGVIEEAIRHVKQAASDVNRQARAVGDGDELARIAKAYEELDSEIARLEEELTGAQEQHSNFDLKLHDIDKKIFATLLKGDQEELSRQLARCKENIKRLDDLRASLDKQHSGLFKSASLVRDLIRPELEKAASIMGKLREQGKIPNTTLAVLRDRLQLNECICGENLDASNPGGARRRTYIEQLIERNRKADDIQRVITEVYYRSQSFLHEASAEDNRGWIEEYATVLEQRDAVDRQVDAERSRQKSLEVRLDQLVDMDVQELRKTKKFYSEQKDRFSSQVAILQTQIADRKRTREGLKGQRDKLLREQEKGQRLLAELEITTDLSGVLERAYLRITNEELRKVSDLMNRIFLDMIGADPEQGAIIQRAEISKEFDILVFGPNGKMLNPDRDLNGASRRALTLAFILALTKVSEVEAPNVIDTPLGMMSGFVKRSVLRKTIEESSQLILFLTRSEIAGCEDILDNVAGKVITLTNPTHFPRMLVHDPGTALKTILRCKCNHRESCSVCDRRRDLPEDVAVSGQ